MSIVCDIKYDSYPSSNIVGQDQDNGFYIEKIINLIRGIGK